MKCKKIFKLGNWYFIRNTYECNGGVIFMTRGCSSNSCDVFPKSEIDWISEKFKSIAAEKAKSVAESSVDMNLAS